MFIPDMYGRVATKLDSRKELYKAVKYEVEHFRFDHGCNLAEMWALVNGTYKGIDNSNSQWWKNICLTDYAEQEAN